MIKNLLFIIILILGFGCSEIIESYENEQNIENCSSSIEHDWLQFYDTLDYNKNILRNAIDERIGERKYMFSSLVGNKDSYFLDVDTIFFSPEKDKFFASLIIKDGVGPNFYNPECKEYPFTFRGRTIVGYKTADEKWRIYVYEKYMPSSFSRASKIQRKMESFYTSEMRYADLTVWNGERTLLGYDYDTVLVESNVDQPEFWTSNFWKKGLIYKGFYNFELRGIFPNKIDDSIILDTNSVKLDFK